MDSVGMHTTYVISCARALHHVPYHKVVDGMHSGRSRITCPPTGQVAMVVL